MGRRLVRVGLGAAAAAAAAAVALNLATAPSGTAWRRTGNDEAAGIAKAERPASLTPAAALLGRPVRGVDGAETGRIVSLLADTRTGRIRFAEVERPSGSNAPNDDKIEVPGAMLRLPSETGQDGPVALRAAVGDTASDDTRPVSNRDAVERELEKVDTTRQRLAPIQDLRGATVRTPSGETLGKVENVVITGNPEPRIAYVTVSRDAGGGTKEAIALPFAACAWRPAENSVLVIADSSTLKSAPVVPADRPAPLDGEEVTAMRRAFGY
jgi:hypothetical protein